MWPKALKDSEIFTIFSIDFQPYQNKGKDRGRYVQMFVAIKIQILMVGL